MNISNIKILYIHHGVGGTVRSLEQLKLNGEIASLDSCDLIQNSGTVNVADFEKRVLNLTESAKPNLIIWHHVSHFPINTSLIKCLKNVAPGAKWAYQEMDAYGGPFKPITRSMKRLIAVSDYVITCGGNPMTNSFRKLMRPEADLLWFGHKAIPEQWPSREEIIKLQDKPRDYDIAMLGSNTRSRYPLLKHFSALQFPGAYQRWKTTRSIIRAFPGKVAVYGSGWNFSSAATGSITYFKQVEVQQKARVSAMWNHYDHLGYYTSDRPIIAMLSGVPHVTNYQPGNEIIFGPNGSHLFWANNTHEYIDAIRYLLSLSPEQRTEIALRAFDFARAHFSTRDSWLELLKCLADRW
jgi:hypothetical protein